MTIFLGLMMVIGACAASFVMSVAQPGFSIFRARSHCDHCQQTLKPFQLIPIVSALIVRSPCPYCAHHPSLRYGLIELIIGLIFLASGLVFSDLKRLVLIQFLVLLSLHIILWDWRRRQIPCVDLYLQHRSEGY